MPFTQGFMRGLERQRRTLEALNTMEKDEADANSAFQAIPGLIGYWSFSVVQLSTGDVYDLSGQGRDLTRNGTPTFYNNEKTSYATFNGTTDFFSRPDEADMDITGTEIIFGSDDRGLTMGGWFRFKSLSLTQYLLSKFDSATERSFFLNLNSLGVLRGGISGDGINVYKALLTPLENTWQFYVLRYSSSNLEIKLWINSESATETASIPSSIHSGLAPFRISARESPEQSFFNGDASHVFFSANALSDATIEALYQKSRGLFGV